MPEFASQIAAISLGWIPESSHPQIVMYTTDGDMITLPWNISRERFIASTAAHPTPEGEMCVHEVNDESEGLTLDDVLEMTKKLASLPLNPHSHFDINDIVQMLDSNDQFLH